MDKAIYLEVLKILNQSSGEISPVSGGDISSAYQIRTSGGDFFCKTNDSIGANQLFEQEAKGLSEIARQHVVKTPEIFACQALEQGAFLLMEFISPGSKRLSSMREFGRQLALLHETDVGEKYGYSSDNFIGSLPQKNDFMDSWVEFYGQCRLGYQIKLAMENKYLSRSKCPGMEHVISILAQCTEGVKPSILHGDLWGGNYLISEEGEPYLIDPAVYYGHSEVDLSMTELFGGFGKEFYDAYYEVRPQMPGHSERRDLYQLYYLLVHLNLFGRSYYGAVKEIMHKYF